MFCTLSATPQCLLTISKITFVPLCFRSLSSATSGFAYSAATIGLNIGSSPSAGESSRPAFRHAERVAAMGKFSLEKCCNVGRAAKAPASKARAALRALRERHSKFALPKTRRIARVADVVVRQKVRRAPRVYKTALKQRAVKQKVASNPQSAQREDSGDCKRTWSVLDMLLQKTSPDKSLVAEAQPPRQPRERVGNNDVYVKDLLRHGTRPERGCSLWIIPPQPDAAAAMINEQRKREGEELVDNEELLHLFVRPSVFVWDPSALHPGLAVLCPTCRAPASRSDWCPFKPIHQLRGPSVYTTVRYGCYACGATSKGKLGTRSMKKVPNRCPRRTCIPTGVRPLAMVIC